MRRSPLLLVVLAWVVAGPAVAADHAVDIAGNRFEPASVTIEPGDRVVWTNRDLGNHTVTADNASFSSGPMLPTEDYGRTFTAPGRYPYHCEVHPSMKGVVLVRAAGSTSSTTSTTRGSATTLPPEGSAVTAPGETTTTTVEETTTTTAPTTTTTTELDDDLAAASDAGDDDTSTGAAVALAALLLLAVAGATLLQVRKGALG